MLIVRYPTRLVQFLARQSYKMAFDNTNRGVLFKNDKTHDAQPDYRGSVDVAGVQYWFSGWIKTAGPNAKNPGAKFLSVSVEEKEAKHTKPPPEPKSYNAYDMDDDIPFSCGVA